MVRIADPESHTYCGIFRFESRADGIRWLAGDLVKNESRRPNPVDG
jgi:hypothetical protein